MDYENNLLWDLMNRVFMNVINRHMGLIIMSLNQRSVFYLITITTIIQYKPVRHRAIKIDEKCNKSKAKDKTKNSYRSNERLLYVLYIICLYYSIRPDLTFLTMASIVHTILRKF